MNGGLAARWRARALVASFAIPPLLYILPLSRLARWLGRAHRQSAPAELDERALAAWVDRRLARLPIPWRRTCLKRSTVLYYLLRRAGRAVSLHIGVRKGPAGALQAHAWLVKDAQAYLEPDGHEHRDFTVIASFPEPPRG